MNLDKLLFVFSVTLIFSIALTSLPTQKAMAAFPGDNGKIAFASDRDGDYEIYIMDADGSNVIQLTSNSVDDWAPAWSPNGSKIAFTHEIDSDLEIYVMNSNGSGITRLTNSSGVDDNPTWSSDGSKIAFDSERSGNQTEIYIMNIDGTNQTVITNNQSDYSPSWSPDGSKIALHSDRDLNDEIYTMDPDGSNAQRLTNNLDWDATPDWHPNGSKIIFVSNRGSAYAMIYVMDADGSNQTMLTNNTNGDFAPAYSPDGMKIVFMRSDGNNTEIFLIDADGSNQTQLTNNTANDGWPSWQPTSGPTPPPSAFTITFDTIPMNQGTITFNGTDYNDGDTTSKDAGSYTVTANVATNYTFVRWETEDSISVSNSSSSTTNCAVSGNGTLRMVQNSTMPPQQVMITFDTEPANMGTITFDGNSYSDGENVSKQTGTYTITANPAAGYAFSTWETSISITVANSTASSTNCTVNGMGTIKLVQSEITTPPPTTPTPEPPPGCIIVTATLGSPMAPEILYMRHVRDDMIGSNEVGKILVAGWNTFYYSWSPPIAEGISKYEPLRATVGILLTPLFGIIHSTAFIYTGIESINTALASTISFLSAAIMSIAVYVTIPILGLRILVRKLNLYIISRSKI
ncbi:CFI-box-CTERM domain-containing protein [[Eubacterium] cellulosolvens]